MTTAEEMIRKGYAELVAKHPKQYTSEIDEICLTKM